MCILVGCRELLAGPVYSACVTFRGCEKVKSWSELKYSTDWARGRCFIVNADGSKSPCTGSPASSYLEVPGITVQSAYKEFILSAIASDVSQKTGGGLWLGPPDVFKVTWYNRQGSYISPTQSPADVSGSSTLYVDKPGFRDVPVFVPGAVGNGLTADDERGIDYAYGDPLLV